MDSYDHFYFVIIFRTFAICLISNNINTMITITYLVLITVRYIMYFSYLTKFSMYQCHTDNYLSLFWYHTFLLFFSIWYLVTAQIDYIQLNFNLFTITLTNICIILILVVDTNALFVYYIILPLFHLLDIC